MIAAAHGSAFGTKRTSDCRPAMSAFGSKAAIKRRSFNVRFSPKADITSARDDCHTLYKRKLS
jgi:hypothetical protein